MRLIVPALLATTCLGVPYEEYILAPSSRDVIASSVYQVNGSVSNPQALVQPASTDNSTFHGPASVTLDFGRNIAGTVSFEILSTSARDAFLGLTFTESSLYISSQACDARADAGLDSPLWFAVGGRNGNYVSEKKHDRGAFRYMTVVTNTTSEVSLRNVQVKFSAAPTQNLRAYKGYFHSNDELLNRIWYAGAYTTQICTIDPSTGNALPFTGVINETDTITLPETTPWYANATISNGSSTLTDGAKRDRLIWPGDLSIATESVAVSTGDLYSVRTAIEAMFAQQSADGRLPYAGKPFPNAVSYTYHLHSLVGTASYYQLTGDRDWLARYWGPYKKGLAWALSSVDNSGLANITASADWLRFGMGGRNIEANAILYYVLRESLDLAKTLNDSTSTESQTWAQTATTLKSSANSRLWDAQAKLYVDNETTTLHPQDGNVWAIKANLTDSRTQAAQISQSLRSRWGPYGAPAPEAHGHTTTISPFIGGFELQAHYISGNAQRALDLMRRQWGFMLDDPRMTNSTFIEGFATDGSLQYAPYANAPRLSFAHGWSTGPTAALSFYTGGLRLAGPGPGPGAGTGTGAAGETRWWVFEPLVGDLTEVRVGFETSVGGFSAWYTRGERGFTGVGFVTPVGTMGDVILAGVKGVLVSDEERVEFVDSVKGLKGGSWTLQLE